MKKLLQPSGHVMKKLLQRMVDLVRKGEMALFVRRAHDIEPADLAEVLSALDEDERLAAVQALPAELSSQALAEMPEEAHASETLAALDPGQAAEIVGELDDDDAADILGELDQQQQEQILSGVHDRAEVDRLLRYDEETAGGRMTTHVVTVPDTATAEQALEEIRRQAEEVEDFYQVFVVDKDGRLVGRPAVQGSGDQPARTAGPCVHGRRRHLRDARTWTRKKSPA